MATRSRKRDPLDGWTCEGQATFDDVLDDERGAVMPSPGPTSTMLARQVRAGDVLMLDDEPHAVIAVTTPGIGQPFVIGLVLDDGSALTDLDPDTPLDVTRPFSRHAEAGEHDEP